MNNQDMPRKASRILRDKQHRISDGDLSSSIMLQTPITLHKKLEILSETHGIPIATFYRLCAAIGFSGVKAKLVKQIERKASDHVSSMRLSVDDFYRLQDLSEKFESTSKDALTAAILAGYARISPAIKAEISG